MALEAFWRRRFVLGLMTVLAGASIVRVDAQTVNVAAGEFDRRDTPVDMTLDQPPGRGGMELVDRSGNALPLQMLDEHHGVFILPELKAKQSATFKLQKQASEQRSRGLVEAVRKGGTVEVSIDGRPAFTYRGAKTELPAGYDPAYQRGGYIYPVLTPAGRNVADDYPPNHKHHHGIWSAWSKTEFEGRHPDFWNMGDKTGTVEPVEFGGEFSGPVCGGFTARHKYVDLTAHPPKEALNETWQVTAYGNSAGHRGSYVQFDIIVSQTCASASPLTLLEYRYGGVAFRGAREWNGAEACQWLTSEGKGRIDGNEARSRWVRVSGNVDGQPASVAILDHPDNFRFPQPIRIFPDQPYCVYSPSQLGQFQIVPGKPFVQRYRFVVADGVIEPAELDRLWNDYAHPIQVGHR